MMMMMMMQIMALVMLMKDNVTKYKLKRYVKD